MPAVVAPISALLLSVALLLMGNGLQGTLLPVRASLESFTSFDIGVMGSAYFLGFAAGCFYGPRVVRRAGHIRSFTAMVAVASSIALVHALILNPGVWWVLRMMTGFCFAVLYMVIESWLNERATNETRGQIFSIYTIINLTVITLGQMMLVLDEPKNFPLFSLASILVSLAAVPIALTRAQAPGPIGSVEIRFKHLYKLSPVGFIGCLAVGLVNGSFWSLAPVYAQRGGGDVTGVAVFMSIAVIAGALGQWPLGRLSDQVDRRKVIVVAGLGGALAGSCLYLSDFYAADLAGLVPVVAPYAIFGSVVLFGIFAFPLYSLCIAHMNDHIAPDGYVESSSGLLMVYGVGAIVGPIAASGFMRLTGVGGLFAFAAMVHLAIAGFAVYRMRRRAAAAPADRAQFADSLRVAQTVSTVDPLSDHEPKGHADNGSMANNR